MVGLKNYFSLFSVLRTVQQRSAGLHSTTWLPSAWVVEVPHTIQAAPWVKNLEGRWSEEALCRPFPASHRVTERAPCSSTVPLL